LRSRVHSPFELRECQETYGITIQKACLSVKGSLTWKGGSCPFGTLALSDAGQPAALDAYASSHIDPSSYNPSIVACYSIVRAVHKIARPFSTVKGFNRAFLAVYPCYMLGSSPLSASIIARDDNDKPYEAPVPKVERIMRWTTELQSILMDIASGAKYHRVMQTLILGSIHRIYLIMIKT